MPLSSTVTSGLLIKATYQPRSGELALEFSAEHTEPGSLVTWLFLGLPDNFVPRISFPVDPETGARLSPFDELIHSATRIHGTTRRDSAGRYSYKISLFLVDLMGSESLEDEFDELPPLIVGPDDPDDPRKPVT